MKKVYINEFLEANTDIITSRYGLFQEGNRFYIIDREHCDFVATDLSEDEAIEYLQDKLEERE